MRRLPSRHDGLAGRRVASRIALKALARRILSLSDEIATLDAMIKPLVGELGPGLIDLEGIGVENAGAFIVAAGDNPERLKSEASFAMMCGASRSRPPAERPSDIG